MASPDGNVKKEKETVNLHIRHREMEPAAPMATDEQILNDKLKKLKLKNETLRESISEFIATFILVFMGDCVIATLIFTRGGTIGLAAVPMGWGLALLVAVAVTGGASGCHANPAVTLAFATVGKLKWKKVLPYFFGQYLGAFVAAGMVFTVYYDSIDNFDGGVRQVPPHVNSTAEIFATYTKMHVSMWTAFLDQVIATGILLLAVVAVIDPKNLAVHKGLYPLIIGFALGALVYAMPYNCMAPLNPARDLSPRLFTLLVGYGTETFSHRGYGYFMIPIVAPHIGAILGCWLYKLAIELHWPDNKNAVTNPKVNKRVGSKVKAPLPTDRDIEKGLDDTTLLDNQTTPTVPLIHVER